MSGLDALFLDLASSLTSSAGPLPSAPGTLTQTTLGTFDPATGTSPNTSTTANVNVVLDSALRVLGFKFSPDLIQSGDIMATIPAKGLPFVPAPGDRLVVPQGTFAVKEVKPTWAGSTPVLYEMLVRL